MATHSSGGSFRSKMKRGRALALALFLAPVAACSVLLNTSADQCSTNADCAKLSATAVCQSGVCVDNATSGGDGGAQDGAAPSDGSVTDGATVTDAGCTPKVPVSQSDFLNEKCTNATCIPFDNCARLGLCDGGSLPALIVPDGGL